MGGKLEQGKERQTEMGSTPMMACDSGLLLAAKLVVMMARARESPSGLTRVYTSGLVTEAM